MSDSKVASDEPKIKSCRVPDEKLKEVLLNEYVSKKQFSLVLLKQDPEPKTEMQLKEEQPAASKQELNKSIPELFFQDSFEIPPVPLEHPKPTKEVFTTPQPQIVEPIESILVQIKLNHMKLCFLQAQNNLVTKYIQTALNVLDPSQMLSTDKFKADGNTDQIRRNFMKFYPKISFYKDYEENPIDELIESLPCSVHELKFLLSIQKEYERRSGKL